MIKYISLIIIYFMFAVSIAQAEQVYNPPFQISGVVKSVNKESIEIYLPYINKQVTVLVLPETLIVNRIDEQASPQALSAISIEDLVVVKGVLREESFCSKNISYLSISKK